MFGREQLPGLRLLHDGREERLRDVPPQQTLPVLGEHGHIPDRGVEAQSHEPSIENVEVQLLHELPLAPDRVQRLEQQGAEELLGRDGRPPDLRVQPREPRRQVPQHLIDQHSDRAQGVIGRHPLLWPDVAKHVIRDRLVAAHAHLLVTVETGMPHRSILGFSAAC
jgi:hypothetical protein